MCPVDFSPHPELELQQAELQPPESGSQAEREPLLLWLLAELVPLGGLAVLVLAEAASPAALVADTADIAHRRAASAEEEVVADKESAAVALRDGRGERSEKEQRELKKEDFFIFHIPNTHKKNSLLLIFCQQGKYLALSEEGMGCR